MLLHFAWQRDETEESSERSAKHGGLIKGLTEFATIAD
jgi:hypothetical protein